MRMSLRTSRPCTLTAILQADTLPGVPSLFQNSRKLSRLIIVLWCELKYVPSQIITAALCTGLFPAASETRRWGRKMSTGAKPAGTGHDSLKSPCRADSMSCFPSCPHQLQRGVWDISHPRAPESPTTSSSTWGHAQLWGTGFTASRHEFAIITN